MFDGVVQSYPLRLACVAYYLAQSHVKYTTYVTIYSPAASQGNDIDVKYSSLWLRAKFDGNCEQLVKIMIKTYNGLLFAPVCICTASQLLRSLMCKNIKYKIQTKLDLFDNVLHDHFVLI